VESVETYSGTSKKSGKPYTQHKIRVNGKEHKTFSDTMQAQAEGAKACGATVTIRYKEGRWGRDIESMETGPAPEQAEQQEPPPDEPGDPGPGSASRGERIDTLQTELGLSSTVVDGIIADEGLPSDSRDWQPQDMARVVARMKAAAK
jgi:hypothetical protein